MGDQDGAARVRVFISYRRDVSDYSVEWLYSRLAAELGSENVFRDRDSISPGEDFVEEILAAVDACDALLALIGPQWIQATDEADTGASTTRRTSSGWRSRPPSTGASG
jgi:hypothetical protein